MPKTEGVTTRRVRAVYDRLAREQGPFTPRSPLPVIDQLVATILSQHTSDTNSRRAYNDLRRRFPSWEEVVDAPVSEIADAIRSGGLAEQKAPRIKQVLATIEEQEGALDLKRLDDMGDQEVAEYLTAFPGVGPKTAACVLVFSMGRDAFPVDTHVHRILRRLGWVDEKASADVAHRQVAPLIPPAIRYALHVAFVSHGRRVCRARRPRCTECVIFDYCAAGPRFLADGEAV
jgi:endonuclease III